MFENFILITFGAAKLLIFCLLCKFTHSLFVIFKRFYSEKQMENASE